MSPVPCAACGGRRLRPESLAVKVAWPLDRRFHRLGHHRSAACRGSHSARNYAASDRPSPAARCGEIAERLDFLLAVGFGYLTPGPLRSDVSPAARPSEFAWPRRLVRACAACCTCSTSLPSACTHATTGACLRTLERCAIWETRFWWLSTMKRPFAAPISSSISVPARARWRLSGGCGTPEDITAEPRLSDRTLSFRRRVAIPVPARRRKCETATKSYTAGREENNLKNH